MKRELLMIKKKCFFITILFFIGFNLHAQRYDFSASSGTFEPLTDSIAVDDIEYDNVLSSEITFPDGFAFNYFGTDYTSFKVSSNGFITLNTALTSYLNSNNSAYSKIIAPLWDDLSGSGGEASYKLTGIAPNRVFTFEWLNWKWGHYASQAGISFQLRLHENGTIQFLYNQEAGSLNSQYASIAIVGNNDNQFYSLQNSLPTATLSPSWIYSISSKPASGQTYTFTPNLSAIATPSTPASDILADLGTNTAGLSWTNGDGEYRVVFMKETEAEDNAAPVNNQTYTANSYFGNGNYISGGWYCVYNGTGDHVFVTGLESGVSYRAQVFEYNGLADLQQYNLTPGTNNPVGITTVLSAPSGSTSSVKIKHKTSREITFNLNEGNGDHRAIFMKVGASETSLPADNTTYEANSIYGTGSQIGISGWYCVFNGNSAGDLTITGLSSNTDYIIHVVDYNGPEGSERYHISSGTDNPVHFKTYIPSTSEYSFEASSGTFTPISDSIAVDEIEGDDLLSDTIPIGFTFYFGDNSFTDLKASSNGWLSFNLDINDSNLSNDLTFSYESPVLAPLWHDLHGSLGQASYNTIGTAPYRVFTMEYLNWRTYGSSSAGISFQVKLYETTGKIEYIYREEAGTFDNLSASIGISFPEMGSGNFLSLSDASASPIVSSTVETNNISTKPATGQIYTFNLEKQDQTITFDAIPDQTIGGEPFTVNAVSSSELPVSLSSASDKITISGKEITMVEAGSVTVTAKQSGGASYNSASPVDRTFCINPAKPVISATGLDSQEAILTSNTISGNQWYKDGAAISGATEVTYNAVESGSYTVTCSVDNCVSDTSDVQSYTVSTTGIDNNQNVSVMVYPNPVENILTITLPDDKMTIVTIVNMNGETIKSFVEQGTVKLDLSELKSGNYILLIYEETGLITKKINKL